MKMPYLQLWKKSRGETDAVSHENWNDPSSGASRYEYFATIKRIHATTREAHTCFQAILFSGCSFRNWYLKFHWHSRLQTCEACLTSVAFTSGHQQSLCFPPVWASSKLRRQIGCYRGSSFIWAPPATWRYACSCEAQVVASAPRSSTSQRSRCLAGVEFDIYYCNNDVLMVSAVNALRHLTVAWNSKIKRLRIYVS
jgi:hypothetical protein